MGETFDNLDLSPLDEVFAKYEGKKGALIPILQRAQAIYGYLPVGDPAGIADRLDTLPRQSLWRHHLLRPVLPGEEGRHTLTVCDGTACHVKGAPALMSAVEQEFGVEPGETSPDGEFTEEIVYCLGSCALAPVAVLDGQVMGRLRPEGLVPRLKRSMSVAQGV